MDDYNIMLFSSQYITVLFILGFTIRFVDPWREISGQLVLILGILLHIYYYISAW